MFSCLLNAFLQLLCCSFVFSSGHNLNLEFDSLASCLFQFIFVYCDLDLYLGFAVFTKGESIAHF